ncbi:MAG: leucyl aminopeptidase family protein, partial [Novosphingobium sp.]
MTDKHALIQPDRDQSATPIHVVDKAGLDDFLKSLPAAARSALAAQKFSAGPFEHAILPNGEDWSVVTGVADASELGTWCLA